MTVEAALIRLGTAAVQTAAKLWLGDHKIAAEVSASAVDVLSDRLATQRDKRRFNRMIENFAEAVVDRVDPILDMEFRGLPENERLSTIDAVRDTFEQARLVDADLFATDLDARHLDSSIRKRVPGASRLLSDDGAALYDLLMRECCGYVIEISRGLPQFSPNVLTELLRRDTQIIDGIRELLSRLPQRDRSADFGYDYRQLVARKLDHVELFGVTLADATRRYSLSVAYISLTASPGKSEELRQSMRIEDLLARDRRLFIRGEAGLGKTTLLQWIAVRSARRDFPEDLAGWNQSIPFFVPLRRYAERPMPTPENFLDEVGRHIADEMPGGWVHQQLRSGHAILLVDGVDELAVDRRDEARAWLRELVGEFPEARFMVTSRPGATQPEWLREEEFTVLDLEPMTLPDVRIFVRRWHQAMRSLCADDGARAEIDSYERGLMEQLNVNSHLRKLAGYPLLCALLCALHKDRRAALPNNRIELYDVALQMILERRDAERKIATPRGLHRTEKTLLLADLAYWLIRNGRSDIEAPRLIDQFRHRLALMPQVKVDAPEVYQHLLERSGLLREPVFGRVDFIHRTFQEYLAARAATTNADDVGTLVANAHMDQWHEVVTMAVGHSTRLQREELLTGLLARADREKDKHDTLELLALASLETTPELSHELREEIHRRAAALLPPKSLTAAKSFGSAGIFVLDLLAKAAPRTARETVATIRAIAETGLSEAMPILAKYASDDRKMVQDELFRNWTKFEEETYARTVFSQMSITWLTLDEIMKYRALTFLTGTKKLTLLLQLGRRIDGSLLPRQLVELAVLNWRAMLKGFEHTSWCEARIDPSLDLPNLTRLEFDCVDIDALDPIRHLPRLEELIINGGATTEQLTAISSGWTLSKLDLGHILNLIDLSPLSFLEGPSEIALRSCGQLAQLDGIDRWSGTLVKLAVTDCPELDTAPISKLTNLEELDLGGTLITDTRPLTKLKALRKLIVSVNDVGVLSPIRRLIPGLRVTWKMDGGHIENVPPLRRLEG